ncbi:MAG: 3-phenylpropionate dioxygenase beta subunit [Frankiales bacterium]|nr:3-phenylpropionate dioxygenase beta subunit [Frankiales bacterium]
MTGAPALDATIRLTHRCERFLLEEADLLDRRALTEWLSLFADDALYWLPMDPAQTDPGDGLNIVYDDTARLSDRVARLQSGLAFSDEPHSITSRVLSGVRVLAGEEASSSAAGRIPGAGEHLVVARCLIGRSRQGVTDTLHGRVTWILREDGDSFRIVVKRIDLLNAHEPLPVLAFLL